MTKIKTDIYETAFDIHRIIVKHDRLLMILVEIITILNGAMLVLDPPDPEPM